MCRNGKQHPICLEANFGVGVRPMAGICRGCRRGRARDAVAKSFTSGDSLKTWPRFRTLFATDWFGRDQVLFRGSSLAITRRVELSPVLLAWPDMLELRLPES